MPFQLVTVPVKAPQLIGHVSMGFALKAIAGVRHGTHLRAADGAGYVRDGAGPWRLLAIGNRMQRFEPLPAQLDGRRAEGQAQLDGEQIALRMVSLGTHRTDTRWPRC